jgi:hypothetical protein
MLIVRRNMRLLRTLPINEGSRTMAFRSDWSVCGEEMAWGGRGGDGTIVAPMRGVCTPVSRLRQPVTALAHSTYPVWRLLATEVGRAAAEGVL